MRKLMTLNKATVVVEKNPVDLDSEDVTLCLLCSCHEAQPYIAK